ncbi:Calx-beta domain-containing protein [Lentzea sp. NPDC004789]
MNGYHRRTALAGAFAMTALTLGALPANAGVATKMCDFPRLVSIGDARGYEGTGPGNTSFVFTVGGNFDCAPAGSVHYDVVAGTADGTDFTGSSGTLFWGVGDTSVKKIAVPINRDAVNEPNETFSVVLSQATGDTKITDSTGAGTILDDDGTPTWNIDDATCFEGDSGTHACAVTISLSNPKLNGTPPTVDFSASNGTAGAADYVAFANQLVVLPLGKTTTTQSVIIKGDRLCEGDETVKLKLSNPSAGTLLADSQAVLTIQEDDFFCS